VANDIRSPSDFKRNTVELLDRLRKTGHPLVLTINGKAEVVVQDAGAYQTLLNLWLCSWLTRLWPWLDLRHSPARFALWWTSLWLL